MAVTFNGVPGFATPGAFVPGLPLGIRPAVFIGLAPAVPTSGGTTGPTIRIIRAVVPGDIPASGAARPRMTGREYKVPVATDVEHAGHAWELDIPPVPPMPGMLDAIGHAAAAAYAASGRAVELGRIFADPPYERQRKRCGEIRKVGGVMLTCSRKPGHRGKHTDRGLDWG